MPTSSRAVTSATFGAWLLKTDPSANPVAALMASGFRDVRRRCVRRSYRTDLLEAAQPVLLWVSGGDPRHPAGLYAQGQTSGRPEAVGDARQLEVPLELSPVDPPVLRSDLLADPLLSRIEVLRMAAGSNPSYLTSEEVSRLRAGWPQVRVG